MNYVVSSIILLSVVLIIIYILSIDNNINKFKNKIKELLTVFKSKKVNYLNEKDNLNILNYIKSKFNSDDNVTIPTKIYYKKTEMGYEMNDINIICYKYNTNGFIEQPYKINILFVPFEKENYISNQSLLGLYGNYMISVNMIEQLSMNQNENQNMNQSNSVIKSTNNSAIKSAIKSEIKSNVDNYNIYSDTNDLDMIPDMIELSDNDNDIDIDIDNMLISHNIK
jgi:hypothetical protein